MQRSLADHARLVGALEDRDGELASALIKANVLGALKLLEQLLADGDKGEIMMRSTDRFLTTHTGSLPRPDDLIRMMYAKEEGVPVDPEALGARVRAAVAEIVKKQADAGDRPDQ